MEKRRQKTSIEDAEFTRGSGNVYTDFGYPDPEDANIKADLAILITSIIKEKGLTQQEAAEMMRIDQPKVSKIMRGILSEFSIERLMHFLKPLGFDIELKITPHNSIETSPTIHVIHDFLDVKKAIKSRKYL